VFLNKYILKIIPSTIVLDASKY